MPQIEAATILTEGVIDDFNREGLTIDVNFPLPAQRVKRALNQTIFNFS